LRSWRVKREERRVG
jgi:hypothetical protein